MCIKSRLYSVKDIKADKFAPPFVSDNDSTAVRAFQGSIQGNEQSMLSTYPEDFQLFYLGEFSPDSGELISNVVHVVSGSSFSKKDINHA